MITGLRDTRYSTVAIVLHWAVAALLIFQVGLGFRMGAVQGSAKFVVFQFHKSVGITILLLAAIRLFWRLFRVPPAIDAKPWERALAHAVHATLYLLLFALPISGWIIVSSSRIVVPTLLYGAVPWPHLPVPAGARETWHALGEFLHVDLAWLLIGLFALHIAGALKHHFVDRDGEIARMVPGLKFGTWKDPRLVAIGVGVVLAAGLGLRWLPIGPARAAPAPSAVAPTAMPTASSQPTPDRSDTPAATVPVVAPTPTATPTPGTVAGKGPASRWTIARSSTLKFRTSWSGEPVDGGFKAFDGSVVFGPDDLPHSRVAIRVDIGSIYSGDAQRDETLKSDDWFAAGSFGTATFTASRFRALGNDRYTADGTLTIKGITLPSTVRFTLTIKDDRATMRGTATVDRTAYRIGVGDDVSTTDIPAAVTIAIAVQATRSE